MKISFRATFHKGWKPVNEEQLNDFFLLFLPKRIEIIPSPPKTYSFKDGWFDIKMETDKLYTLEDIKEKFDQLGVTVEDITMVKREFTKKELEEVKRLIIFKEIFKPSEVKAK